MKFPGGLNDVGLRTLDTVSCNGMLELTTIVDGNIILTVVALTKLHTRPELAYGSVIPHNDDTLGSISKGN